MQFCKNIFFIIVFCSETGIARLFLRGSKSSNDSITINYYKDYERMIDFYNVTSMSNGASYFLNDSNSPLFWGSLDAGNCYNFTAYAVSQGVNSKTDKDDICTGMYICILSKCA